MRIARFRELPIGARFNFRARRYEKIGLDVAGDDEGFGSLFHENAEVSWDEQAVKGKQRKETRV